MNQVIEILRSLGINDTVFYQFAIFFVAYISMNFIVFKPYLRAHEERIRRTEGGQKQAEELTLAALEKEQEFQVEARKLNEKIKEIFARINLKAKKETEEILLKAKQQMESDSEAAKKELDQSILLARKEMEGMLPEISQKIQNKFVGN
jgi:F0F1-type ATP synthase membrane subunit b/b'